MTALSMDLVLARAKCGNIGAIKQLNLFGCNIGDLSICEQMTSVEVMALTKNDIKSLEPLKYCKNLKELYLRQNDIQDLDELDHLKGLEKLELLCLTENPCCVKAGDKYRQLVLGKLPKLKKLDSVNVRWNEVEEAMLEVLLAANEETHDIDEGISANSFSDEEPQPVNNDVSDSNDSGQSKKLKALLLLIEVMNYEDAVTLYDYLDSLKKYRESHSLAP